MQTILARITHLPFSMLALVILMFYTYGIFDVPYTGFYFNPSNARVLEIYTPQENTLQVGDVLLKVGNVSWKEYDENNNQPMFSHDLEQDTIIPILVNRNGLETTIEWHLPGFNIIEFRGRLFNIWWLSYIFWVFGAIIELFIRPREIRWYLLLATNHLTAIWLVLGSFSAWHIWGSALFTHALSWVLLPLYLHLQWVFPQPLTKSKKFNFLGVALYALSFFLCIGEIVQAFPNYFYALAIVCIFLGSLILQILHYILNPNQRKHIRLLVNATLLAILPLIALGIVSFLSDIPSIAPIALLALPFISATYIYLIFRNQLGGLEAKANLFISSFAFLILAGTLIIIAIYLSALLTTEISAFLDFVVPLLVAIFSIRFFQPFRKYIEKSYLGISIDTENLAKSFSNLIVTNTTMQSLLQMLETDVFPSLLIRQYAFVQVENHHLHPLLMKGVTQAQLPEKEAILNLHERAGKFIPNLSPTDDWLRLILPLKVGDSTLGFFLLGSRDPDDIYHQQEISSMQSIVNQTGIALSNILRAETLREMYGRGMDRYEQERLRLGHDLHDSVLNELNDFHRNLGDTVSEANESLYKEVIARLREIVMDLRPPTLAFGLSAGISGLAENLMQEENDVLKIQVNIQASDERLPENIELHLFRIVQEACKNSLHHANASLIKIHGSISPQQTDLVIEDNGKGFDLQGKWTLDSILAKRHFGLVGIVERAHIIGAKLNLQSQPNQGTRIQILWSAKN